MITELKQQYEKEVLPHTSYLLVGAMKILKNYEDAQDAVQDTLIKAYNAWERFDAKTAQVRTWLTTINNNVCYNRYRQRLRKENNEIPIDLLYEATHNREYEKSIERKRIKRSEKELHEVVELLPDIFADVIKLNLKGYNYQETANMLDVALGTVKSRIYRGKKQLRKIMGVKL